MLAGSMACRKYFVCGQRKEEEELKDFIDDIVHFVNEDPLDKDAEVVVALPEAYLQTVSGRLTKANVTLAADYYCEELQEHFSAQKVKDSGGQWVLLGQSKKKSAEGDCKELGHHLRDAQEAGLKMMVCVGDTLKEREMVQTHEVLSRQMQCIADNVKDWEGVVVVYRPWWAMGTCKTTTPFEVQHVHKELRNWLAHNLTPSIASRTRIVFGGFVSGNNCLEMAIKEHIDGFLVAGASFSYDFLRIVNARK